MNGYWISLKYATFGVFETNGIVTDAAPIANWTKGKLISNVLRYYHNKGAKIERLNQ